MEQALDTHAGSSGQIKTRKRKQAAPRRHVSDTSDPNCEEPMHVEVDGAHSNPGERKIWRSIGNHDEFRAQIQKKNRKQAAPRRRVDDIEMPGSDQTSPNHHPSDIPDLGQMDKNSPSFEMPNSNRTLQSHCPSDMPDRDETVHANCETMDHRLDSHQEPLQTQEGPASSSGTQPEKDAGVERERSAQLQLMPRTAAKGKESKRKRRCICDVCEATFNYPSQLKVHRRTHTGERPYSCKECDLAFKQKVHLLNHARLHTRKTLFQCRVCPRNYSQARHLQQHMKTHREPHTCEVCGQSFIRLASLARHERIHKGEGPYKCMVCHCVFSRLVLLKRHQLIHTGDNLVRRVS